MHVEKFRKDAVGHMLQHYSRMSMNFGNTDIDHLRSDLNYNLAPKRNMDDIAYYKHRLSQVRCQNRADVKTLCDWVITLPKTNFTENEEMRFFQTAYDFMKKRYGEKNIISSWVHKDEKGQAHMHFAFIPVCIDTRKQIEKVSAKEVITRNELRMIHREMAECMERTFGRDIGVLNGSTANGNKTVMELKAKALQEDIIALEAVKTQSLADMALAIKRKPRVLSDITKAIHVAMVKEQSQLEKQVEHERERSR